MNEVHEAEKKQAEPFLYPYQIALLTLERNEQSYECIETVLDVKFGKGGVALMPRVLQIYDPAALKSLIRFLVTAPDLDAVIERLTPTV
jgi:hypothetical protein